MSNITSVDPHLNPGEELYEPADAARTLNLTPVSIHRLTNQGLLPAFARTVRGTRLYRRIDVEALAARRRLRVV